MKGNLENEEITPESAANIANEWMEIADVDGSGTVDFGEYKDFILKLSPESTEEELKEMFDSIDQDGSGELDLEEFGKAIYECLKPDADEN